MIKRQIILTENDIAKIINGEELKISSESEEIIIRQSYAKDILADIFVRKNRVMNTVSNTFEY